MKKKKYSYLKLLGIISLIVIVLSFVIPFRVERHNFLSYRNIECKDLNWSKHSNLSFINQKLIHESYSSWTNENNETFGNSILLYLDILKLNRVNFRLNDVKRNENVLVEHFFTINWKSNMKIKPFKNDKSLPGLLYNYKGTLGGQESLENGVKLAFNNLKSLQIQANKGSEGKLFIEGNDKPAVLYFIKENEDFYIITITLYSIGGWMNNYSESVEVNQLSLTQKQIHSLIQNWGKMDEDMQVNLPCFK